MNDVIIAIVPAPGHEGLTADGPLVAGCRPERPMTIRRCSCGVWGCPSLDGVVVAGVHHATPQTYDVALVLHAPGGPRLGMVRAMEAVGMGKGAYGWSIELRAHPGGKWSGAATTERGDGIGWDLSWHEDVPVPEPQRGVSACVSAPHAVAYALAHLLLQFGKGSEVLVLPVPA